MTERSDGSTASYYTLPPGATQLQDLISHRDMNAQVGEIFRECYRYGMAEHSDQLRGAKKILFYAKAEVERLERLEQLTLSKNCESCRHGELSSDSTECAGCVRIVAKQAVFTKWEPLV